MSKKQKMTAVVISQQTIAEEMYSMWLKAEPLAAESVPGHFISMYTNDGAKLLPRPISLCEIDKEKGALRVVYRVTGEKTGTKQFSQMKAGDSLEVMGPLGNGFDLETGKEKKALLFGGGIGVPPMLDLAKQLTAGYPFYGLALAYEAGRTGGSLPTVFNAANEMAVGQFLNREIKYLEIIEIIEDCMRAHKNIENPTLDQILETEAETYARINSRR